jgi:RluA family pseudouridine synthase
MERKPFAKISRSDSGSRLVDWLSRRFTYLSADAWLVMLGEGRIRVEGRLAVADRVLAAGEIVAFDPPRYEEPAVDTSFSVIMEDEDFLIVDKSGNLPCHPGGRYFEHSLWRLLSERYGEVRIATRLDRETSGLVLVCKSAASAAFAQGMLSEGAIEKEYLALVHGPFPPSLEAKGYLTEDIASAVRKKRRYVDGEEIPQGKRVEACSTSFRRVGEIDAGTEDRAYGRISLVRARPATGRTHQIRATLFSLGFPVVGDKLYGLDEGCFLRFAEGGKNEEDLTRLILPNQALHCAGLSFRGSSGRAVDAKSVPRWPSPFREILDQLP